MPDCFSRPICALAMQLNDEATDEERQHLLPFVTCLGCADTAEAEREREVYIASRLRYHLPFRERLNILKSALAIGRQADLLAPEEVRTRMAVVQQNAVTHTSVADHPMFAMIKSLFGSAKKTEPTN
ncbi:hypothetical protein [Microvirga ossetica]|uniref:hypothetical protein n=1 Tax=Microvirga ossetica TaxID=1882682 RepID=UPI003AAEAE23